MHIHTATFVNIYINISRPLDMEDDIDDGTMAERDDHGTPFLPPSLLSINTC